MPDSLTVTTTPRMDGRNARSARTKRLVLEACRRLMCAGDFRPSVVAVAEAAGVSVRSVFQHHDSIEALHLAALDHDTRIGIFSAAVPGTVADGSLRAVATITELVHAAVFGRPAPTE